MKHSYYTCDICGVRFKDDSDLVPYSVATFLCTTSCPERESIHHLIGEDVCSQCREKMEKQTWLFIEQLESMKQKE